MGFVKNLPEFTNLNFQILTTDTEFVQTNEKTLRNSFLSQ